MLGEALPPRTYRRNPEELDALLGGLSGLSGLGSLGFDVTGQETDHAVNAASDTEILGNAGVFTSEGEEE